VTALLTLHRRSCWGSEPFSLEARQQSAPGFVRRSFWAEDWKRRRDAAPACLVCGRLWTPRTGDLHEPVPTLGRRAFEDFIPLCWAHHAALHVDVRAADGVRRLGYRGATHEALQVLRQRHHEHVRG
jgi:hypothetical protein